MAENKKDKKTESSDKNDKSIDKKEKKASEKKAEPKSSKPKEADNADKEVKGKAAKAPMSDDKKQNILGLAVIGIITAALLISGMIGVPDNSIPTASNDSGTVAATDGSMQNGAVTTAVQSGVDSSSAVSDITAAASGDDLSSDQSDISGDETSQDETSETETAETQAEQPQVTTAPEPQVTEETAIKPTATKTTTAKSSQTQQTTATATAVTTAATTTKKQSSASDGLSVRCVASNSWESEGSTFTQVDIYVENGSSSDISGWTVKITVPDGAEVSQQWNGDYSISGTTLTVKPAEYNSTVSAGGEVNAGCIIRASGTFTPSASVQ